jgi:radical SAM superfamily enzyme YgiQ (UPF0313 family)
VVSQVGKKKILLVYPSSYDERNKIIKSKRSFIPSRTLPYLAALIPKRYECRIVDELVEDMDFDKDVDIVMLTGMLRHMPRAIDIAGQFKKRGKTTIIGGVGAFAVRDLIRESGAFDCQVMGEAEDLLEIILTDYEEGRLKSLYECSDPPKLNRLPHARFDLVNEKKYMKAFWDVKHPIIPIETSRGCPNRCKFCLVSRFFGNKMRYRPISEVVEEIKYHESKFILFTDDNIAVNTDRSRELFLAIKPLKVQWIGQFESRVIEHPELLRLASESGCESAFVGIESLIAANLRSVDKKDNIKFDIRDIVKTFKQAKIPLLASMIFGMDNDTPETIAWTIEQMIQNNVDAVIPWIFTPVPGTPTHTELKNAGSSTHENYSLYDCWHSVIKPKAMSSDELEKAFWNGLRRFYSARLILERILTSEINELSATLYHVYFYWQVRKNLHPFAGNC